MTKTTRFKALKVIMALALALALCLGTTLTAFAGPLDGTEANPAKAGMTKMLQMPEGTTTPAASFTFTVTKKSVDGKTTAADLTTMPTIANKTVSFTAADLGTTTGGVKSVHKETGDIFGGLAWPHAGVYTYTIKETANTYTISDPAKESMTYSSGTYELTAYVENGTGGNLYVKMVESVVGTPDTPGTPGGTKVDPTPGGKGTPGDYSKMIFTNTYLKNNGGPNPTDSVLSVSKVVAGPMSDQTKYFDCKVNPTFYVGS